MQGGSPRTHGIYWLEAAAVMAGYVTAAYAGGGNTPIRVGLLVAGAACVAVPVYLKSRRARQATRDRDEAQRLAAEYDERLATTLDDVVTPIAALVAMMSSAPPDERQVARGQLLQAVVEAAAQLCGGERTRAIFFERSAAPAEPGGLSGDVMVTAAWTGRGDQPTTTFRRGADPGSDAAFALLDQHSFVLVEDTGAQPLPEGIDIPPDAPYRSFISIGVYAGNEGLGLLTVDAPEPGQMGDPDLQLVRALAQLLGAGLGADVAGRRRWVS